MPPISLSDSELAAINGRVPSPATPRSRSLPERHRGRTGGTADARDGAVHRTIATVQRRHFDPPDLRIAGGKYR
jgi:hypothetical protein